MITYEKFKEIIVKYIHFTQCENTLRRMNIDVFESPLFDTTGYYLDWLWEAYFSEDAVDTINWWMFEYHDLDEDFDLNGKYVGDPDKEPGMWDKDDNVIPMITIKDLWNEVKDQRLKLEGDTEELKGTIKNMVELQLRTAAEPVDMDVLNNALGDEWKNVIKFFGRPESMVCVDNTDEAIADIMATYLENKTPYKTIQCESCEASIFLDSEVGVVLVLSADNFELYVWQQ
jgi:hypothetical protein